MRTMTKFDVAEILNTCHKCRTFFMNSGCRQNVIHAVMRMSRFHVTPVQRSPRNDSVGLRTEKPNLVFREHLILLTSVPENGPQLPAQTGLHQHVDVLTVLECLVQPEITELEQSFVQYGIFKT